MNRAAFISAIFASSTAVAADFTGMQFSLGAKVSTGTLLDCEAPDPLQLKQLSPKMFSWAVSQGLAEQSTVTGTPSYTAKVTTRNSSGQTALFIGCWITTGIVKETVNGRQKAFAKGAFRINESLRSSPLAEVTVCKKKKGAPPLYAQGDYRLLYEGVMNDCKPSQWQDKLTLSVVERETVLFELRESIEKKGYIREVGW